MEDKKLFLKYNLDNKNTQRPKDWKLTILLHGSYKCNSNCSYCLHKYLRKEYGDTALISQEILKQIIDKLGNKTKLILWHGGEPTLIPDELIQFLEEEKTRQGYWFPTSIQSNGILLQGKLNFYKSLNIQVATSYDGLNNADARSKNTNKALDSIKENKDFINVVTKENITKLIENYEYCKSIGLSELNSYQVRESIGGTNEYLIDPEVAAREYTKYLNYWIQDTNNPLPDFYLIRYIDKLLGKNYICEDVFCQGEYIIIDPEGYISFCDHITKNDYICNINDINSYEDLINHPKYQNEINKQNNLINTQCINCEYKNICFGGCMGMNYMEDKNYTKLNQRYCTFNKLFLNNIYETIKDIDINDNYNPYFISLLQNNNFTNLNQCKILEKQVPVITFLDENEKFINWNTANYLNNNDVFDTSLCITNFKFNNFFNKSIIQLTPREFLNLYRENYIINLVDKNWILDYFSKYIYTYQKKLPVCTIVFNNYNNMLIDGISRMIFAGKNIGWDIKQPILLLNSSNNITSQTNNELEPIIIWGELLKFIDLLNRHKYYSVDEIIQLVINKFNSNSLWNMIKYNILSNTIIFNHSICNISTKLNLNELNIKTFNN